MLARIINIAKMHRRNAIKKRIKGLSDDLEHQIELWMQLFNSGNPHSAVINNIMVETEKEIVRLERQLY